MKSAPRAPFFSFHLLKNVCATEANDNYLSLTANLNTTTIGFKNIRGHVSLASQRI